MGITDQPVRSGVRPPGDYLPAVPVVLASHMEYHELRRTDPGGGYHLGGGRLVHDGEEEICRSDFACWVLLNEGEYFWMR